MNIHKYILRSLCYYRRSHLALLAGVAIAVTVIVGALAVGDSVRKSLLQLVEERLGSIHNVMVTGKYFPGIDLAETISEKSGVKTAPMIALQGSGMSDGGAKKIPEVNLYGINKSFCTLFSQESTNVNPPNYAAGESAIPKSPHFLPSGEAVINATFAEQLGVKKGEVFIIRIPNPGILPEDIALTKEEDSTTSLRLMVKEIADDSFPGDFSLKSQQEPSKNVFVSLEWLGKKIDRTGRCNLILAGKGKDANQLNAIVDENWRLKDIGLEFREIQDPASGRKIKEMISERIFIEDEIGKNSLSIPGSEGVLVYFVNSLTNPANGKSSPYSFVAAIDPKLYTIVYPEKLKGNRKNALQPIVINSWLAEDLNIKVGEEIELSYFVPGRMRQLIERKKSFRVSKIVAIKGWSADKYLMPDFPGLADTDNCSEWDPGIPINLKKVRDKDEKYWDDYRGIPKAFITLKTGQEIWRNQFGSLTAVRFQKRDPALEVKEKLSPAEFGLSFIDIGEKARLAAKKSVDFSGLFLALSFFIIFSAFILTAMLFVLSIKARKGEITILSNLGFRNCEIRRMLIIEHAIPAILGTLVAIPLGMIYNMAVIDLLNTLWQGAVGTTAIKAYISPIPALIGSSSGLLIALITIWLILRNQLKNLRTSQTQEESTIRITGKFTVITGFSLMIIALAIVVIYLTSKSYIKPSAPFFAAGGLLLVSFWCFAKSLFNKYRKGDSSSYLALGNTSFRGIIQLSIKNCTCNIMRSMSGIMLLSCGIFLTLAVAINLRSAKDLSKNSSGTGGYKFFIKTSLPVVHDLNSEEGRKAYGLDPSLFKEVEFVQMRLSDGNEASCLNLNRVENPAILGVDFSKFAKRKSFSFNSLDAGIDSDDPWKELDIDTGYEIPVVADNDVIMWIMGKKVGGKLEVNDENGKQYDLTLKGGLSNSIFQGYAVMSIKQFIRMYPSSSGAQVLLVDCPDILEKQIGTALQKAFSGLGAKIEPCRDRLRRFQKVENTYLSIFLVLGGLGLIIGAAGFGIVVIRNILERREELAIMYAVGFSRKVIRELLIIEHLILILFGVLSGGIAAGISAVPAVISSRAPVPWNLVIGILAGIIICGICCVYAAALFAIKATPIKALRKE